MRWAFVGVACVACGGQLAEPLPDAAPAAEASTPDAAAPDDGAISVTHCIATEATALASQERSYRIAIDDEHVYWLTLDDDARRVAKGGGPIEQLGAVKGHVTLALAGSSLYAGPGDVVRLPKNGGTAQSVVDGVQAFAVDAAETTIAYAASSPTTIFARPLPSGTPTTLATLSYVDTVAVLAMPGDGYVYYGTEQTIARVPIAGGPIEKLAPGYGVETFAFDATTLFFAQQDGHGASQIFKVPRAGGTPLFMWDATAPRDLGVNDTRVFWADTDELWEEPKTTVLAKAVGPTQQASGSFIAPSLAIDDACIYWGTVDPAGSIYAMPIPAQ